MNDDLDALPAELLEQLMPLLEAVQHGGSDSDRREFVRFVLQHADQYPVLLNLVTIDKEKLTEHIEQTGQIPPGIKAVRTRTEEGSNVVKVDIFHGPATVPPDDDESGPERS